MAVVTQPTLRVLCAHVPGGLRQQTYDGLLAGAKQFPVAVRALPIDPEDDYAYGRLVQAEWEAALEQGQGLAIVEQDIVPRPDVFADFLWHPGPYVAFPYAWTTNVGPALGCTRWSYDFIAKHPDAPARANATRVTWKQFDVVFMRHVLARDDGEQPTVLLPPVVHLNEAKALLPDADPTPMMEVPLW